MVQTFQHNVQTRRGQYSLAICRYVDMPDAPHFHHSPGLFVAMYLGDFRHVSPNPHQSPVSICGIHQNEVGGGIGLARRRCADIGIVYQDALRTGNTYLERQQGKQKNALTQDHTSRY